MAENKRQSINAKAQSQQTAASPTAMAPTDEALSKAIGAR